MIAQSKRRMTVQEFLTWAAAQPRERARHNLVKAAVFRALGDAVARAALPCTVFTDGMTVVIDNEHSREPDAAVQCDVATDLDSTILEAPLIVVEVASPSSERDVTGDKLVECFSVPSIRHYLIVKPEKRVVIHHARNDAGDISTRIVSDGEITLHPPGIAVAAKDFLAGVEA
jgi:Uma2 family endonuclease